MTETDKLYYTEMLKKGRMVPFVMEDKLVCFLTFYICNNAEKYITSNPWEVLEDEKEGRICVISQLLTDKVTHWNNPALCYRVWKRFKDYIRLNFPTVKEIYWHRWNNGKVNIHRALIKKER